MAGLGDTIAAIATPVGCGGVGVVRVSGPGAEQVLRGVVAGLPRFLESRRIYVGWARDPGSGRRLDEVIAFLMRGPRSYTGEDVVELQGHGGAANLASLLGAAVAKGARIALPGEFTRRAFVNGRVDLIQAEAVADVIVARSQRALRQAQARLGGSLGGAVRRLRGALVSLIAELEAGMDFPEEGVGVAEARGVTAGAAAVGREARALAATYRGGRAVRDGIEVALVGKVNVGKSSLLNALLGVERVVVDAAPHTTRDFVEARTEWEGVGVTLVDTAGWVEAGGAGLQARAAALGEERARGADVVLVVVEADRALDRMDERMLREFGRSGTALLVRSKSDRGSVGEVRGRWGRGVLTSSVVGLGLEELRREVLVAAGIGVGAGEADNEAVVGSERQLEALVAAAGAAEAAAAAASRDEPAEVVVIDLRVAVRCLGAMTGEEVTEEVVEAIFGRFCVGK